METLGYFGSPPLNEGAVEPVPVAVNMWSARSFLYQLR
jgi:hypothetical protein